MKKIAIFVEGKTELIFVRDYLFKVFGYEKISLICFKLQGGKQNEIPYSYSSPSSELYFEFYGLETMRKFLLQ